jgi:hypothetical protein
MQVNEPGASQLRNKIFPGAQRFPNREGSNISTEKARAGWTRRGAWTGREHKDDPGIWETPVSPRETPARRGAGDLSPRTLSVGGRTLGVAEP